MSEGYRVTGHAQDEMARRGISPEVLEQVMTAPGQIVESQAGRKVYQSQIETGGKLYVVRAVIEEGDPPAVVTVYRTSKIDKYWSKADESDV